MSDQVNIIIRKNQFYKQTITEDLLPVDLERVLLKDLGLEPLDFEKDVVPWDVLPYCGEKSFLIRNSHTNVVGVQIKSIRFTSFELVPLGDSSCLIPAYVGRGSRPEDGNMYHQCPAAWAYPDSSTERMYLIMYDPVNSIPIAYFLYTNITNNGMIFKPGPCFNRYGEGNLCLGNEGDVLRTIPYDKPYRRMAKLLEIFQNGSWNTDLSYTEARSFYMFDTNYQAMNSNWDHINRFFTSGQYHGSFSTSSELGRIINNRKFFE